MTRPDLTAQSVDRLVERFAALAMDQDRALLAQDIGKVNRLFDQLNDIADELKGRPGDQRRALTALYTHANLQVQIKAAKATLAIEPGAARAVLARLALSRQPQALEAGMCLLNLDSGQFKPM